MQTLPEGKAVITYRTEQWPAETPRPGGQHVGTGPAGVRVTASVDGATVAQAACSIHRSQWANRRAAMEAIEWMLTK